jgi:hypothetical protein
MASTTPTGAVDGRDLLQALAFARVWFDRWLKAGLVRAAEHAAVLEHFAGLQSRLEAGGEVPAGVQLRPADVCWSCKRSAGEGDYCPACGAPVRSGDANALRYLTFLGHELGRHEDAGRLPPTAADGCLVEVNARIAALRKKLDRQRVTLAEAEATPPARAERLAETLHEASAAPQAEAAIPVLQPVRDRPARPRRNLMEILLDPRSIQWLLACGGALLVLGLIIWLWAEGIFANRLFVAGLLGAANVALLVGGWAVIRLTRHELAGRALTLLACLVMPFNLWFYDAQGLITLREGGHLWIPALVCCVLYAASARLLRDPTFVYVFMAGIAGTGLLILADRDFQRFWEIAAPASLLVALGLLSIHAERAFPEGEGPFARRRFGMAFFWSGHVLLGAGLLLLLGADVAGNWLFDWYRPVYAQFNAAQPEIVTTTWGRLLSLALVLAGTYAYVWSDLVVRRVGAYIGVAVLTLLWAEVLLLQLFWPAPPVEVVIAALAVTGLLANVALTARGDALVRAGPPLALVLSTLPVVLGLVLHVRATAAALPTPWHYTITGTYVAAMLAAALSCRAGAFLYRHRQPALSVVYFFGTGAATMLAAAGLLLVLFPEHPGWQFQAPVLMLIPVAYLIAARLYGDHTPSRPLAWVAHAATVVMLLSSIGAAFRGFLLVAGDPLNLTLALFFAEAALFYALQAAWRRRAAAVYACTATACAGAWQLLQYGRVPEEYYILSFALVGLALLAGYRFAVLERVGAGTLARAAFRCANALLSLALVGGVLLTLSELALESGTRQALLPVVATLAVAALLAVPLARVEGWRRWYVAMAIAQAGLAVFVLLVRSHLEPWQRLEIVGVVIGFLLLGAGHVGWYREQEGHNDLVTVSLVLGSLLVAVPLAAAVIAYRVKPTFDAFHTANEVTMLAAGLVLLAAGLACRIQSTTVAGAALTVTFLVTLFLYVRLPERLQTTAVYIMAGGGLFFVTGLVLSLYRDRLLHLPERIKRREGVFRVLTWR